MLDGPLTFTGEVDYSYNLPKGYKLVTGVNIKARRTVDSKLNDSPV